MRLAIVCSWLNQYGGAERVLEVVHAMYPQAPVYTSIFAPDALPSYYRDWDIRTSFLDRLPLSKRLGQVLLPLYPLAFESLDLRGFDVVLSITSGFGHGVLTACDTQHVCYCLTPARFLWGYHSYVEREGLGKTARMVLPLFLKGLRQWDHAAADRVDQFVAISRTVQRRIRKHYQRDSTILYPPVNTASTQPDAAVEDYYLIVSRLVPYKRIDLAIEAFNTLGRPLRIVGDGRDYKALKALAKANVEFVGYLADDEVRAQMARCRAFIFPGEEDFGIAPLEAMAEGRPVIAFAAGGALDTNEDGRTGLFFHQPTPEALAEAVRRFEQGVFDPQYVRRHARRFDVSVFREQLAALLERAALIAREGACL